MEKRVKKTILYDQPSGDHAMRRPTQKNDTLWPAKRDIFLTNFDAIFWSSWQVLYVKVRDHFGSKLVTILIQSWWPFWSQLMTPILTKSLEDYTMLRMPCLQGLWACLLSIVFYLGQKFDLARKFATNLNKNLPPTWTKICHQLEQKLATIWTHNWQKTILYVLPKPIFKTEHLGLAIT